MRIDQLHARELALEFHGLALIVLGPAVMRERKLGQYSGEKEKCSQTHDSSLPVRPVYPHPAPPERFEMYTVKESRQGEAGHLQHRIYPRGGSCLGSRSRSGPGT